MKKIGLRLAERVKVRLEELNSARKTIFEINCPGGGVVKMTLAGAANSKI